METPIGILLLHMKNNNLPMFTFFYSTKRSEALNKAVFLPGFFLGGESIVMLIFLLFSDEI